MRKIEEKQAHGRRGISARADFPGRPRNHSRLRGIRSYSGGSLTFTTVLLFALLLLGIGYLAMLMFMGGENETQHACDAGALNVGKKTLDDITVPIGGSENQRCFADVADASASGNLGSALGVGKVSLRTINRVWAKALLIAINAEAARNDGNAGSGGSSAQSAYSGAKNISDSLSLKLSQQSNLHGYFNEMAGQNSVRMLGLGATVRAKSGSGWKTSFLEQGGESNIVLAGKSGDYGLPPGFTLNSSFVTDSTREPQPSGASNYKFLKGYTPLQVGGQTFWQVPFLYDEKPHLVSGRTFMEKQNPSSMRWSRAVPNSFSCDGIAQKSGGPGQTAISYVLTNPRQTFKMCMPHSFVHIKLDEMKAHYYFYPTGTPPIGRVKFGTAKTYNYMLSTSGGPTMPQGGLLSATVTPKNVSLGLDVVGRSLDEIIFGMPPGNRAKVERYMVNRINEMISKVGKKMSASDLHSALSDPSCIGFMLAGQRDFYLFSPDGSSIRVAPKPLAIAQAPWLATMISKEPDGQETKLIDDATMPAPIFFMPTVIPDPFCQLKVNLGWGSWHKDVYWEPGTGYNGNLGRIRVKRWTEVDSLGICTPII